MVLGIFLVVTGLLIAPQNETIFYFSFLVQYWPLSAQWREGLPSISNWWISPHSAITFKFWLSSIFSSQGQQVWYITMTAYERLFAPANRKFHLNAAIFKQFNVEWNIHHWTLTKESSLSHIILTVMADAVVQLRCGVKASIFWSDILYQY